MSNLKVAKNALKAAEVLLEEAIDRQSLMEKQHKQSISEIVHDIKNPLSAMIGYLSLIGGETAGPVGNKTYANYFKTVDKAANRLLGICNSLLGEYTNAKLSDEAEKIVNVSGMVDEIHDLFAAQAVERGIKLIARVDDNIPDLEADPQSLYRALMNLVSNAIKFTPHGGKVEILTVIDPREDTLIMVVRDSGIGMTKKQIEQVTKSGTTTISPHGDIGTGQGLSIVSNIVTKLGGRLNIISTENRGTKIIMNFPQGVSA